MVSRILPSCTQHLCQEDAKQDHIESVTIYPPFAQPLCSLLRAPGRGDAAHVRPQVWTAQVDEIWNGASSQICELSWTVNCYVKCFIVKFLIKFFGVHHTLSITWSAEKTNAYCAMTKANGCLFTELDTYGENILTNYLPFSKTDKHSKVSLR